MVVVTSTSSFSAPAEGVLLEQPSSKLIVNDQELGTGTLYITENNVTWGGGISTSGGTAPLVSLNYRNISLHAIQREPTPSLYMILDYELRLPELNNMAETHNDEDDFDPEETPITQIRFVPQNHEDLQAMYTAMCDGQALHPDPDVMDDEPYLDGEDMDDDEFEDAEESNPLPEDAASRLGHLRLNNANGNQNGEANGSEENEED